MEEDDEERQRITGSSEMTRTRNEEQGKKTRGRQMKMRIRIKDLGKMASLKNVQRRRNT